MFVRILYTNNRKRRQNKWHAIFPIPTAPAAATMAVAVTTVQTTAIPTAVDATMVLTTAIPTAVDAMAAATNAVAVETVKQ